MSDYKSVFKSMLTSEAKGLRIIQVMPPVGMDIMSIQRSTAASASFGQHEESRARTASESRDWSGIVRRLNRGPAEQRQRQQKSRESSSRDYSRAPFSDFSPGTCQRRFKKKSRLKPRIAADEKPGNMMASPR
jgi:hypothetical protein